MAPPSIIPGIGFMIMLRVMASVKLTIINASCQTLHGAWSPFPRQLGQAVRAQNKICLCRFLSSNVSEQDQAANIISLLHRHSIGSDLR